MDRGSSSKRSWRPGRRTAAVAASVLVLSGATLGVARAAIPDANTSEFQGCVNKATGVVRLIDPDLSGGLAHCITKSGLLQEQSVAWNQAGIQGIQGIPGIQGIQGIAGPPGINGKDGKPSEETATWTVSYVTDGVDGPTSIDSADPIALGDSVQAISASITGDFSSCTDRAEIFVNLPGTSQPNPNTPTAFFQAKPGGNLKNDPPLNLGGFPPIVLTQGALVPSRAGLGVTATCLRKQTINPPVSGGVIPTPSFTLTYDFNWIHTPPVVAFN